MKKPLILHGGVDINPLLYGQKPMVFTQEPNLRRDRDEWYAVTEATEDGIPVVGICRGAQLLCAWNKGTLIQHSVPHQQHHSIQTKDGFIFDNVSASHHQIMQPAGEYEVLAWNPSDTRVWHDTENIESIKNLPEVVWYPKYKHLGIQAHPEWAEKGSPFVAWINNLLKEKGIDYAF